MADKKKKLSKTAKSTCKKSMVKKAAAQKFLQNNTKTAVKKPKRYVKYIGMVEENDGHTRTQYATTTRNSLTASGRWTDAKLHSTKKAAEAEARAVAAGFGKKAKVEPFVRRVEFEIDD